LRLSSYNWLAGLKTASLGFAALGILIYVNRPNPAYVGISPPPYLLVAIVIGTLLGLRGALVTSPLIAVAYVGFLALRTDSGEIETIFTLQNMLVPLAILVMPALLGAICDGYRLRLKETSTYLEEERRLISDLERINDSVIKEKTLMENRLTSQVQTLSLVFEYAQRLETTEPREIAEVLVEMVCEQAGEDNCYAYLLVDGGFRLTAHKDALGRQLPEALTRKDLDGLLLPKLAIESRKVANMEDLPAGATVATPGCAAALFTPWGQELGFIYVRHLHFLTYLPSTFTIFGTIARWGSNCLARSHRPGSLDESSTRDPVTGLPGPEEFTRLLAAEMELSTRVGAPLQTLEIEIENFQGLSAVRKSPVLRLTASLIQHSIRVVDSITLGDRPGRFHVILPLAQPEAAASVVSAVTAGFEEIRQTLVHDGSISLSTKVQSGQEVLSALANPQRSAA